MELRKDLDYNKVAYLPLTRDLVVYFDRDMFSQVARYRWCACHCRKGRYYAERKKPGNVYVLLHQEILRKKEGYVCDHKNNDTMDNRRSNLHLVPRWYNAFNRTQKVSGYYKKHGKWIARVQFKGQSIRLGRFDNKQEAISTARHFRKKLMATYLKSEEYKRVNQRRKIK